MLIAIDIDASETRCCSTAMLTNSGFSTTYCRFWRGNVCSLFNAAMGFTGSNDAGPLRLRQCLDAEAALQESEEVSISRA